MKIHLDTSLLLATLLLLPACASTPNTAYEDTGQQSRAGAVAQDDLHMARVEKMARQRGIRVIWVNPVNRRVAETVAATN